MRTTLRSTRKNSSARRPDYRAIPLFMDLGRARCLFSDLDRGAAAHERYDTVMHISAKTMLLTTSPCAFDREVMAYEYRPAARLLASTGKPNKRCSGRYQCPVFSMEAQGSCLASDGPFCRSSMEMLSGERMKAIFPSRGGRLITTPLS